MKNDKKTAAPAPVAEMLAPAAPALARWEHLIVTEVSLRALRASTDTVGADGWELVAATQGKHDDVPTLFFKRPLRAG